jgi:hypothetical protein
MNQVLETKWNSLALKLAEQEQLTAIETLLQTEEFHSSICIGWLIRSRLDSIYTRY